DAEDAITALDDIPFLPGEWRTATAIAEDREPLRLARRLDHAEKLQRDRWRRRWHGWTGRHGRRWRLGARNGRRRRWRRRRLESKQIPPRTAKRRMWLAERLQMHVGGFRRGVRRTTSGRGGAACCSGRRGCGFGLEIPAGGHHEQQQGQHAEQDLLPSFTSHWA